MRKLVLQLITLCLLAVSTVQAGTTTFNFDSDPAAILDISSNVDPPNWRSAGGNPATGGYLAISDSVNSQYSVIVFDDFDGGLIVKAFSFSCDVRVGNPVGNGGRPADGFSISYARASDPVVLQANPRDTSQFAVSGGPENGTSTGIAISFDTWSGNALPDGADIEGLIVRVDNVTVLRQALPTRNGGCTDITSLQTGPYDEATAGSPDGLCWAKVEVILDDTQKLTVKYKGTTLLDQYQTQYAPSAGRLVLAGRTGGANENTHIDNISITTVPADTFVIGPVTGSAVGFQVQLQDSGPSVVDQATIAIEFDGAPVTPTSITKTGSTTFVNYKNTTTFLASGSNHTVKTTAKDTRGVSGTATLPFTVPAYTTIPASYALAAPATDQGVAVGVYQMDVGRGPGDANAIRNAEQQWARGYLDTATGQPYANVASVASENRTTVNWEQDGINVGGENFSDALPVSGPVPNEFIPGIPGVGAAPTDNIVAEIAGYMRLTRGYYRMGVNSDDGFIVSVAGGTPDVFGLRLGAFDGGRGASDTLFNFVVEQDGDYPVRLLWWEGGGGANVEWFTVNTETGVKSLINGTDAGAIKVYRTGNGRARVKSLLPANGFQAAPATGNIKIELVDGRTTVVDGSVSLTIDGAPVNATVVNGATTTVSYSAPAPGWPLGSTHTGSLVWTESTTPPSIWTNNFTFTIRKAAPDDYPATTSFWIEAEDFNNSAAALPAAVNTMPYTGGAYDQASAVVNVDYGSNDGNDSDVYRIGETPNKNINDNLGGRYGADRPGAVDMTVNYKLGWVDTADWGNYTRTIPAGTYSAVAALSYDGTAASQLRGKLSLVTAGVGTANQTLADLGTFNAPGSGGWGPNDIVQMKAADGSDAVFKIRGTGATTLRFTMDSGDFDWFMLYPANVPAKFTSVSPLSPNTGERERRDVVVRATIEDFSTTVAASAVRVKFDGIDVTAASTITKVDDVTTVTFDPPGLLAIGSSHDYEITATDSANNTIRAANNFKVHVYPTPGTFLIEAEDFNSNGKPAPAVLTAASTMPYLGGAFTNLTAVLGTDYNDNDGRDSQPYRGSIGNGTAGQNVNHDGNATAGTLDTDRGEWSVTANYKIGWVADGNWYNYTRNFPAGSYQVWAALSYDGRAADQLNGRLELVDSPTAPTTTNVLGTFNASGTGGWGANNLVQMQSGGATAVVSMNGEQTVRYNPISGDYDYLVFVPVVSGPRITGSTIAGGNITITWTGGGTLETATELRSTGTQWTTTGDSDGSYSEAVGAGNKFYRVRQ